VERILSWEVSADTIRRVDIHVTRCCPAQTSNSLVRVVPLHNVQRLRLVLVLVSQAVLRWPVESLEEGLEAGLDGGGGHGPSKTVAEDGEKREGNERLVRGDIVQSTSSQFLQLSVITGSG
jgi:hypothetical protein